MAWLELHTVLIRHRKVNKLARKLNIKPVLAVGHLTTFWGNVLELATDGDITKWDIEDIANYACWEGDPKLFYEAMINDGDGFIDEGDNFRLIHDWWHYAGKYLTSRYMTHYPEILENIKVKYGQSNLRPKEVQKETTNLTNQPTSNKLVNEFYQHYKHLTNQEYIANPHSDNAIFKMLLKSLTDDDIRVAMSNFFVSNDPFIQRAGYTIGVFKSMINKLRTPTKQYV